jgi:aminoglycoside phosphotransferase (APT) family kinase protein
MKKLDSPGPRANSPNFDLDALLHPARAFAHPRDVVADPDLTLNEKRAILASWASDACAIEAAPALRCAPGSEQPVSIDAILEALRDLDKVSADTNGAAWRRRQTRRRSIERFRTRWPRAGDDSGNTLSH